MGIIFTACKSGKVKVSLVSVCVCVRLYFCLSVRSTAVGGVPLDRGQANLLILYTRYAKISTVEAVSAEKSYRVTGQYSKIV